MGHTAKLAIIMGSSFAWMDGRTASGMTLHPQPKLSSYLLSSALMHLSAA